MEHPHRITLLQHGEGVAGTVAQIKRAEAAGVDTKLWKMRALVVSGMLAAAAGGFYACVLLVVTPDPPTAPKVGGNPLSWLPRLLDIAIGERLSRDLHTARSFNRELEKLQTLGVSSQVLRKELDWRILNIVVK